MDDAIIMTPANNVKTCEYFMSCDKYSSVMHNVRIHNIIIVTIKYWYPRNVFLFYHEESKYSEMPNIIFN